MADQETKTVLNTRLVQRPWGFELHRRLKDDVPESVFAQYGAGNGVSLQEHLGRQLTAKEAAQLAAAGFVEVA